MLRLYEETLNIIFYFIIIIIIQMQMQINIIIESTVTISICHCQKTTPIHRRNSSTKSDPFRKPQPEPDFESTALHETWIVFLRFQRAEICSVLNSILLQLLRSTRGDQILPQFPVSFTSQISVSFLFFLKKKSKIYCIERCLLFLYYYYCYQQYFYFELRTSLNFRVFVAFFFKIWIPMFMFGFY